MKGIKFLPKTKLGQYSVLLIVLMLILFYIGRLFVDCYGPVSAGKTILQDIVKRPGVALPMLAGFISGIIAFITGLIAVIKKREGAVLVFVSIIIGALLILFLIGEIVSPH